ncbi:2-succinyl-5-enolpyruvyl-6-hydroxy-3-cyclohexene-1-carboxylic-acid synthase [Bacteroides sp. 214]|uniref:2-succinyl-5-enolpyruvyl-6-hydroxy-3- cyclohexene-1-carboxylic-acid synthase n=1 Tax=Bacteroides sp. 214 TaxID=2302935 RepID=UPI0013D0737D|nr:2-succinyl-5-enolpyruvyl-6-hydroxy-3-cyclohexene-1-carboxylic-acid synthase [Bacteroides sp. 214]NDW12385.1 2-succinyl-5-enolpyruvyl-6-hydroxy-3-cyclohexene-1-carboxylic-acid synthase [Bacteroides sp. 214]
MYTDKKNVLELVALLIKHEVNQVVVCPGSRNLPLVHTLVNHSYFTCHTVADERSAAFFALGLALHGGRPAAVCCTSGTALANMHPAVAEAFYQQVPLIVISADRPAAWIGQMDGQTIPQPNIFGALVKKSVTLPEIRSDEDKWYCNRLINEALMELTHRGKGPVHINVPISEPLFNFTTRELPEVRVITRYQGLNEYDREFSTLIGRMNKYNKRMMIAGQMTLIYLFEKRVSKLLYKHFVWFTEHLSNRIVPGMAIKNFDALLYSLTEEQKKGLRPELVVTYGGHVVSKRLKEYLRAFPPREHWHISLDGSVTDTFGSLTTVIEIDPFEFLDRLSLMLENKTPNYPLAWEQLSKEIPEPDFGYSQMSAIGSLMKNMPPVAALHLANSSTVRYAQLYTLPETVEVCCNRGTSGIDGSLSTALGYASKSDKINFIAIGDLSFFYDMNALWMQNVGNNVRILLLNNGGGEIFRALPGLEMNEATRNAATAVHHTSAKAWAQERGFSYIAARNDAELTESMTTFIADQPAEAPILLEVFTNPDEDIRLLKTYYHGLRKQQ